MNRLMEKIEVQKPDYEVENKIRDLKKYVVSKRAQLMEFAKEESFYDGLFPKIQCRSSFSNHNQLNVTFATFKRKPHRPVLKNKRKRFSKRNPARRQNNALLHKIPCSSDPKQKSKTLMDLSKIEGKTLVDLSEIKSKMTNKKILVRQCTFPRKKLQPM